MRHYVEIYGDKYPATWAICPCCDGEGKSSAHLGSFTMSEFDEQFDLEEQENYFNGDYDKTCAECKGSGKVLEPIWEILTKEQQDTLMGIEEDKRTADYERRMGC